MEETHCGFCTNPLPLLLLALLLGSGHGASPESSGPAPSCRRHHFVLVHGSCHGAWSWYRLTALLRSSGHVVTALDLAASGIDPRQARSLRSISDYHEPLTDFMASLNSSRRVVLVGHSLGGLAVAQAMERFPDKISVAVFVSALMPGPSLNVSTLTNEVCVCLSLDFFFQNFIMKIKINKNSKFRISFGYFLKGFGQIIKLLSSIYSTV